MKKFWNKRKSNNKGFSLVEVLLAVVILGLIAAPILQMFYSSMAMNQKSKKYLAASELAQTTIEHISSQTWKDNKPLTSNTTNVEGLDSYYNGATKTGNKKLYNSPNAPDAYVPVHTIQGDKVIIAFRKINYGGYKFCAVITFANTNSADKYYSIPVTVAIYDPGDNPDSFSSSNADSYSKLAEVATTVANVK